MSSSRKGLIGVFPLDHIMVDTFAVSGGVCMADGCRVPVFIGGHFEGAVVFSEAAMMRGHPSVASWHEAVFLCTAHAVGLDVLPDRDVAALRERRIHELRLAYSEAVEGRRRSPIPELFYPFYDDVVARLCDSSSDEREAVRHALHQLAASLLRVDRDARNVYATVLDLGEPSPRVAGQMIISIPELQSTCESMNDWLLLPGIQGLHREGMATVYWDNAAFADVDGLPSAPLLAVHTPVALILPMRAWYKDEKGITMRDVLVGS